MRHRSNVGAIAFLLFGAICSGCRKSVPVPVEPDPEHGIALTLATSRARAIDRVRYSLAFTIPATPTEPVTGRVTIRFVSTDPSHAVVLDFEPGPDYLTSVSVAGRPLQVRAVNGHLILPKGEVKVGENVVDIRFRAADAPLNRNPDFLYTLFVPARAHLAFPCFDQPDLKARFTLELTVPVGWQAVTNGAELARQTTGESIRIQYAETQPLPTYLFAFAAGAFQVDTAQRHGRTYRMFHRETDANKVARNRDAIFDLHAAALDWLEHYTAIPYRFGKFDFVLVPSFQFGGMEHPGAIYYNATSVLLDESATENQILGRATLISHETAHMWFGGLVTMRWFNDVWMKEVLASFLASKIVNPSFPHVNHELRFLVSNYPAAYAVDRTAGTHAIRQELANLDEAGSLYGAIIYQKAPIAMRQLERLVGIDRFQQGLRVYLERFEFGNATWLDLVRALNERTDRDLSAWSRAWVEQAGRPTITTDLQVDGRGIVRQIAFTQADPQPGRALRWPQQMEVLVGTSGSIRSVPIELQSDRAVLSIPAPPSPQFVLPTGAGLAYGDFSLDQASRAFLLEHLVDLNDPLARGATWVTLWEEMLDRRIQPAAFLETALRALSTETVEQNVQLVTGYTGVAFWTFLSDSARQAFAPKLERTLRAGLSRAASSSMKSTYFSAFRSTVTTRDGVAFLEGVWRRREKIPGLIFAETDEAAMALELAVRSVPGADSILEQQRGRLKDPDRKARFEFVMPALSALQQTRDAFFQSLSDPKNRRREPWVLEGVGYLNHPLRATQSEQYLRPALELLPEIQRTGDVFFPKNWTDAMLRGHTARASADMVRTFLAERLNYPPRLRRIILQSADTLFRAAEILESAEARGR